MTCVSTLCCVLQNEWPGFISQSELKGHETWGECWLCWLLKSMAIAEEDTGEMSDSSVAHKPGLPTLCCLCFWSWCKAWKDQILHSAMYLYLQFSCQSFLKNEQMKQANTAKHRWWIIYNCLVYAKPHRQWGWGEIWGPNPRLSCWFSQAAIKNRGKITWVG